MQEIHDKGEYFKRQHQSTLLVTKPPSATIQERHDKIDEEFRKKKDIDEQVYEMQKRVHEFKSTVRTNRKNYIHNLDSTKLRRDLV